MLKVEVKANPKKQNGRRQMT